MGTGSEASVEPGHQNATLPSERTALLVIDMQRYFVEPDYPFGRMVQTLMPEEADAYFARVKATVVPNIQQLLTRFRTLGMPVYFCAFGSHRQDGQDLPGWAKRHNSLSQQTAGAPCYPMSSDPSWQIHESVSPLDNEQVVAKTTSGPLNSTKMDHTLRLIGVDTVVVTGVATNVCVTQTAREFADRDFDVIVPEDACAALGEDNHRAALQNFGSVFGQVSSTAAVLETLLAPASAAVQQST